MLKRNRHSKRDDHTRGTPATVVSPCPGRGYLFTAWNQTAGFLQRRKRGASLRARLFALRVGFIALLAIGGSLWWMGYGLCALEPRIHRWRLWVGERMVNADRRVKWRMLG